MGNLKTIAKLSILTILFLGMVVYTTSTPPHKIDKTTKVINMDNIPKTVKLINDDTAYDIHSIIKEDTIIVVANHDSIAVVNTLDKYMKNLVIVTNISAAPWFVKKWIIPNKLTALKGESKTPWIYDDNGAMRAFLKIKSDQAPNYEIFQMKNNKIIRLFDAKVKDGALDGSMSEDEIKTTNLNIVKKIDSF